MILLGALALLVIGCNATDYCKRHLCVGRHAHIGCNNPNKFAKSCISPKLVDFNKTLQDMVLDIHNKYRNEVASGAAEFAQAARMPLLGWDKELAQLAEYNVRQCAMRHDTCRNTDPFPYVGQNLGFTANTKPLTEKLIVSYIKQIQDNWYSENNVTFQDWLDKYTTDTRNSIIGHFTAMIQDRSVAMGCSAATYQMKYGNKIFNAVLLACNYSYTNMINYPVYVKGDAGSKCKTGLDKTYTSLCSSNENIVSLPIY